MREVEGCFLGDRYHPNNLVSQNVSRTVDVRKEKPALHNKQGRFFMTYIFPIHRTAILIFVLILYHACML